MKISKILVGIAVVALSSCHHSDSNKQHKHGPNGEHLDEQNDHTHDQAHHQEVFEIERDTIKADPSKRRNHDHSHKEGHNHSH